MKKYLVAAASAASIALTAGMAHAAVVTFDDAAGNSILDAAQSSFDDQGLTFTNGGSYMYVYDGSNPNGNGTNANIFAGFGGSDVETITKTGGGAFTLNSIDMAISWYDGNPTETILVNGNPLTISQTLTTYNLNLVGVTSVTITGVPSTSGYWLADNVVYNGGVPEPATWALMIGGFGLAGVTLRRRRSMVAA